jgi:hypothetical protein
MKAAAPLVREAIHVIGAHLIDDEDDYQFRPMLDLRNR